MPGESKKISELESASSLNNGDLLELASVNALSETGYSSKKTTIGDVADKIATLNPQAQADWTEADDTDPSYIQNKPTLATVATSGSYNDLSNKPEIPDAQVNSDWNSVSGVSAILNKPTLGTSASKDVGVANGVAELDANGLVPTSQLPAYVDDVLEYASQSAFPATGETGKIYVALDTNLTYRWSGSAYVEISPSLALGETSSTAYAGNKGKANADAISAIQTTLSGLATVATSGNYNDLTNKPAINDATITFTQGGTTKGTITLNQAADATIALDAGGGGGASALDDLSDVSITNPTAGQVLKYDATNDEWINGTGGGGSNSVELTYAEYQALTPAQQLDGTEYFITDINGDGQQFQPIIYSEEEREIGVWTDGKPLYERSFTVTADIQISTNTGSAVAGVTSTYMSDIEPTLDSLVSIVPSRNISNTLTTFYPLSFNLSNGYFRAYDNPDVSYIGYKLFSGAVMTFRYTKITDQAGSGTWTPQGVPAHHYSTDEQVVGTWVDGKTVYEKTINVGTITTSTTVAHGIDNLDTIIDYSGFGKYAGTDKTVMPFQNPANGYGFGINTYDGTNLVVAKANSLGSNVSDCYMTLRYTKSST